MLQRAGGERGITIHARELAVRAQGVTCTLSQEFFIDRLQGSLGQDTEALANLFSPEWQVALSQVSLELRDSALQAFGAAGVLNVPFLDSLLELGLTARLVPAGLVYDASITAAEPGTMATPLGAVAYQTLALTGEIGADLFAAAGTITGLAVDVESFPITCTSASVQVRRGAGALGLGDAGRGGCSSVTGGVSRSPSSPSASSAPTGASRTAWSLASTDRYRSAPAAWCSSRAC
jgi:hypothetical protein